jgi:hypothetical protein
MYMVLIMGGERSTTHHFEAPDTADPRAEEQDDRFVRALATALAKHPKEASVNRIVITRVPDSLFAVPPSMSEQAQQPVPVS